MHWWSAKGCEPEIVVLANGVPEASLQALLKRQTIARFGTCEDVANCVDFFLREESAFITGQTIYLGGVA